MNRTDISRRALLGAGLGAPLLLATAVKAAAAGEVAEDRTKISFTDGDQGGSTLPRSAQANATTGTPAEPPVGTDTVQQPGFTSVFNVGQYQDNGTYCAPGAAATVLTNYRVSGVSQPSLASVAGTSFYGTGPGKLASAINRYKPADQPRWASFGGIESSLLWIAAKANMQDGRVGGITSSAVE